ncbi:MAG TPA: YlmC/YmxH family sporulation protein, partial [Bacillales bacterium]|nr:YlmC/YmxH family sporulation protein [Bacillales bacterium]
FGKEEGVVIPWKNILKIGQDVILVRYSSDLSQPEEREL